MNEPRVPVILLAKPTKVQGKPTTRETLNGHLNDVFSVAVKIVDTIGLRVLDSLGLGEAYSKHLQQALCLASYLHDLGKANSQFQRALIPANQLPQALRHEWISTWLPLRFDELDRWLFCDCSVEVKHAVLFSVLGHHLKLEDGSNLKEQDGSGETNVTVFCNHRDFELSLRVLSVRLGRQMALPAPMLPQTEIDLLDRPLGELRSWFPEAQYWYSKSSHDTKIFIGLVKALLIASDVAGSAVPAVGIDPANWTERVLERVCLEKDLNTIACHAIGGHPLRHFQSAMAESSSQVVFTRAGCGSGKTVGAYLWAASKAQGRKVFFCYPTTGTATEGFSEYIPAELSVEAALLHSRSECDLESLHIFREDIIEESTRLQSLKVWDVPLIVCTVDQVLGLMQNSRKSLFSFPTIGNGAFVFDEIHQYDDRLFGALLSFLDTFRCAPTLLMTASLPKSRLDAIKQVLSQRQATLDIIEGPEELESIPRYVVREPIESPPWEQINETLHQGGNILWVANTVNRCMQFFNEATERGMQPLPYHSRYRYGDRMKKHKAVIDSFKKKRSILAITTQVCEVSLDISADLLISDLAPVPALIQRLGRLNRRVTPENPGQPKPAVLLTPKSEQPYDKVEFDNTQKWLKELGSGPLSQADLAASFESMYEDTTFPRTSAWLDGGVFSPRRTLRKPDVSIPVIRSEDERLCLNGNGRPISKEVTRYTIPMLLGPVVKEIGKWKQLGYAFVAPAGRISYSEEWGAKWAIK